MPVDSQHLFLTMFAMIGGLMSFALLLLLGVRIVKWLKLPVDLPEGPRFEPPPPPTIEKGDRAQAAVVAHVQTMLRGVYEHAHQAVRAAFETQELHNQVSAGGNDAAFKKAAAITSVCAATAHSEGNTVEQAFMAFDKRLRADRSHIQEADITATKALIDTHLITLQRIRDEARAAVAPLGDGGGNRRLIIMVVALAVMIVWVVLMKTILKS